MGRAAPLAAAAVAAGAAVAAAHATTSPTALRDAIFAAARAQRSLHYVARPRGPGGAATIVADVAAASGVQRIAFRQGSEAGRATVRVVRRTAYIRGDAFTLRGFFGFSASQARRYAGVWISIGHRSRAYPAVAAAVTSGSFLAEIYPQADLVRVFGSFAGRRLVGVRGSARHEGAQLVETVYARPAGTPLPVLERERGPAGYRAVTEIGPWNRPLRVRAPAHAVPFSRVVVRQ
jgi:hypothetical protein